VTLAVLKRALGHFVGHRCAPARPHKHQRRCTRSISLGSFTHTDAPGSVRLRFTGRVNGHKLKPGHYALTLTPRAGSITGSTVIVPFRILP
jgi:hypothetical protein